MLDVKDRIMRWTAVAMVFAILVGGLVFAWPTYRRSQDLRAQDAELAQRIREKQAEIERLVENQRRFKTDRDFVEKIARQNRRVYPGELVFVFEDK